MNSHEDIRKRAEDAIAISKEYCTLYPTLGRLYQKPELAVDVLELLDECEAEQDRADDFEERLIAAEALPEGLFDPAKTCSECESLWQVWYEAKICARRLGKTL